MVGRNAKPVFSLGNNVAPFFVALLTFLTCRPDLSDGIFSRLASCLNSLPGLNLDLDLDAAAGFRAFFLSGGCAASTCLIIIGAVGFIFFVSHLFNQSDSLSLHCYFYFVLALLVVFSTVPPEWLNFPNRYDIPTEIVATFIVYLLALRLLPDTGREPAQGAVFVTGAANGMGRATAMYLSTIGYKVFAADMAFKSPEADERGLKEECERLHGICGDITAITLDVTSDESVEDARNIVEKKGVPLFGVINCAGMGYTGPAEYFPMDMYKKCLEVNFFGYIRVAQKFLPLVKDACKESSSRRGRFIFVGTGGGSLTNTPGMLSAYMSSKWAGEAFASVLRSEMRLTDQKIDTAMVNPGFIKPTTLAANGLKLIEQMWDKMKPVHGDSPKETYGGLIEKFHKFTEQMPGTDPIYIAYAMEEIMGASRPKVGYRVGWDSKLSPFVGMLPFCMGEHMAEGNMFPPGR